MSRQAAIITGVIIIVLLLVCNLAVAVFAIPRVLQYFRPSTPVVTQPTPAARPVQPQSQGAAPTAVPQPTTAPNRAPQTQPQPQATPRAPQGGQPNPQVPPQVTIIIPGGGSGAQALPSATAGPSPTLGPSPTPFATVAPLSLSVQEQALAALYNRTRPGVVNVDVIVGPSNDQLAPQGQGSGSGFVWDKNGYIVTNNHVVANARTVRVTLWDDTSVTASVVGVDPDADLAVLQIKVPAEKLIPLELGDSDQVRVGQTAIALGNPFSVGTSMSMGIVSAVGRSIPGLTAFQIPDAIQTDAPINPGNSGGPLLDAAGRVIGVNAQIRSETRANSGVGFAIPVNIVKAVVPDIINTGKHAWPWLGLSGLTVTQQVADANKLKDPAGAYIDSIVAGGPAAKGGVKGSTGAQPSPEGNIPTGGDVVTAVDGQPVRHFDDLLRYVSTKARVGQTVELTVLRDGKETKLKITLEERPRTNP